MLALALTMSLAASTEDYNAVRQNGNNAGLGVLGAWALASTVTGIVGLATSKEAQWRGAHIANVVWGLFNMGFSVVGLYLGLRGGATREGRADALADGVGTQNVYALGAALDVVYLAAFAMILTGFEGPRVQGFAKASLVQALWLLAFDGTMATFHHINNERVR